MFIALLLAIGSVCAWLWVPKHKINFAKHNRKFRERLSPAFRGLRELGWSVLKRTKVRAPLRVRMANIAEGVHGTGNIQKKCDAALTRYTIVKVGSDIDHVAVTAATADVPIGVVTDDTAAAEDLVNVQLFGNGVGTCKLTANGAITAGSDVYMAAAGGKAQAAPNANSIWWKIGRALNATTNDGDFVEVQHCVPIKVEPMTYQWPITLAQITGTMDVASLIPIKGARVLTQFDAFVQNVVTTAAKLATLNLKINAVAVTGGAIALTSANCTPLGVKIAGTAITATNVMADGDTLTINATAVTAFAEGAVIGVISYLPI